MNDESTPTIVPFEAALVDLLKHEHLQGCASGYDVNPSDLAAELLTTHEWSGPWLTCYMLRRFGWPNIGSDDQKQLMRWVLTTPKEGLFLTVTPYMGNAGDLISEGHEKSGGDALHFGYLHTKEVGDALHFYAPAWRDVVEFKKQRVKQWWAEVGHLKFADAGCAAAEGETCVLEHHTQGGVKWGIYVRSAKMSAGLQNDAGNMTQEERDAYFAKELPPSILVWITQHLNLTATQPDLFADDPFIPSKIGLDTSDWPDVDRERLNAETAEHEKTVTEPIREALRATLRDLLRPVYVRDVGFNALGRSDDYNDEDASPQPLPKVAQSFAGAGYTPEGWLEMQKEGKIE